MQQRGTMLKVLSPVEGRDGRTFWMRIGNAFINRDGSTNVYLNAYPANGKLHIRPFDERDFSPRLDHARSDVSPGDLVAADVPEQEQDELPF